MPERQYDQLPRAGGNMAKTIAIGVQDFAVLRASIPGGLKEKNAWYGVTFDQ